MQMMQVKYKGLIIDISAEVEFSYRAIGPEGRIWLRDKGWDNLDGLLESMKESADDLLEDFPCEWFHGCDEDECCRYCPYNLEVRQTDDFPVGDWQYEVANGDTKLGYEDWLKHKIEAELAERRK